MVNRRSPPLLLRTKNRDLAREMTALGRALELPSTILIFGESGTGKDYLARAIHDGSSRSEKRRHSPAIRYVLSMRTKQDLPFSR